MAQGELEKKIELNWLSAFYGGLLTPKQRDVMRMHCEEDLSLGEIAQEAGISRQGVHDLIKRCDRILEGYEEKLGLIRKFQQTKEKVEEIHRLTKEFSETGDGKLIERIGQISTEILELG